MGKLNEEQMLQIKSVCADGDYVNGILLPIECETTYLKYTEGMSGEGHSAFALYDANKGKCTDVYTEQVEQRLEIKILNIILAQIVDEIGGLPEYMEEATVNATGSVVGNFMAIKSDQWTFEDIADLYFNALKAEAAWYAYMGGDKYIWNNIISKTKRNVKRVKTTWKIVKTLVDEMNTREAEYYMNFKKIKFEIKRLEHIYENLEKEEKRLEELKNDNAAMHQIQSSLQEVKKEIRENKIRLKNYYQGLNLILKMYESTEMKVTSYAIAR